MLKSLHTFIRKAAAALLLTAAGTLPMLADGTIPYRASFDNTQMRYSSKGEYSKIKSTDIATYGEIGAPALPVRTYRFVVPVYTGKFTVSMTLPEKASETVTLDTPVMPVQRPVKAGDLQEEKFTIDTKAYNKVYAPKAWVVDDYFIDGSNHIVTVAVMPVEYNPVASTMKYYPYVDIKLNYADVAANEMSSRPVFTKRPDPNLDLSKIAVNGESPRRVTYHEFEGHDWYKGTYFIISPSAYISAFKELAEWKRSKGYYVVVQSIENIISNSKYAKGDVISGINDDAGKLRMCLRDSFETYGRSYVLLAGDYHTNFPIRLAYTPGWGEDDYSSTDVYFMDMTGNWDANRNKKYGEMPYSNQVKDSVNFYPDMFVGRLLCKNAQEVENYTRKLMLYERNPGLGNYSYLSKGLVSVPDEKFDYGDSFQSSYYNNERDELHNKFDSITELISKSNVKLYTGTEVVNSMNQGYGFNLIEGHGQPHNIIISKPGEWSHYRLWAKDEYNDQPTVETNVGFDNLTNITQPSILFASSCTTTPFDSYVSGYYNKEYTLGAAYTVAGLYGGVSYIGYTRPGYITTDSYYVKEFLKQLNNGLSIGNVLFGAKYSQISNNKSCYSYLCGLRLSLIGDPEMNVWTRTPKAFNINLPQLSGVSGTTFNSMELIGANMTVSDGQKSISRKFNLSSNSIVVPDVTNCSVTFTKPGCLPQSFLFIDKSIINDERIYFMTSGTIKSFYIMPGGNVTIYASGDVTLDGAFNIYTSGTLNIITDGNIWLKNGTLDTGGMMNLKARGNIHRTSQFKLKGGFLQQSKIQ